MKTFFDDERATPDGRYLACCPDQAIEIVNTGEVTDISLDHDLGDDDCGTGYDIVLWIEEQVALNNFILPAMKVRTANVSARTKMENGIGVIEAMVSRRAIGRDAKSEAANGSTSAPAHPVCGGELIDICGKLLCTH